MKAEPIKLSPQEVIRDVERMETQKEWFVLVYIQKRMLINLYIQLGHQSGVSLRILGEKFFKPRML